MRRAPAPQFYIIHQVAAVPRLHLARDIAVDGVYPEGYTPDMIEIRKTTEFANWLNNLRDIQARSRVLVRIERLASGLDGDVKPVGSGVSELRIHYGPGYRVYFKRRGRELIILLAGGDKKTQSRDIRTALQLAENLQE